MAPKTHSRFRVRPKYKCVAHVYSTDHEYVIIQGKLINTKDYHTMDRITRPIEILTSVSYYYMVDTGNLHCRGTGYPLLRESVEYSKEDWGKIKNNELEEFLKPIYV